MIGGPPVVMPHIIESSLIRVIWPYADMGEQVYDLSPLAWAEQRAVREELKLQGGFVQEVPVLHPMAVLVAKELRERFEAEQKAAEDRK